MIEKKTLLQKLEELTSFNPYLAPESERVLWKSDVVQMITQHQQAEQSLLPEIGVANITITQKQETIDILMEKIERLEAENKRLTSIVEVLNEDKKTLATQGLDQLKMRKIAQARVEELKAEVKDCQSLILAFANDDQLTIDTDVRVIGLEKEIARLREQINNFPSDCPNCACSI